MDRGVKRDDATYVYVCIMCILLYRKEKRVHVLSVVSLFRIILDPKLNAQTKQTRGPKPKHTRNGRRNELQVLKFIGTYAVSSLRSK